MTNGEHAAFGHAAYSEHGSVTANPGLTKREYFAAMAMSGILAGRLEPTPQEIVAIAAVEHADELIERLNEQK